VRRFIQQTDLFYLTGIDQEETILVICPDAREEKHREILFLRETNEKIAVWEGNKLTPAEAAEVSGIRRAYWTSRFEEIFRELALESEYIYLNANEHARADVTVETRDDRFIRWCRSAFPLHEYRRIAPVMHHPSCDQVTRRNRSDSAGLPYHRKGLSKGARIHPTGGEGIRDRGGDPPRVHPEPVPRPAYDPIIASGADTCVLHYIKNDKRCEGGGLLLMDFGAEYANYASDLTRTVPVNGRFSARQRAVYDAVLKVQRAAIDLLRPGNTLKEYQKRVGEIMEGELIGLNLLNEREIKDQDRKPLYRRYFMHGTSHHMGLDVHDYGINTGHSKRAWCFPVNPAFTSRRKAWGFGSKTISSSPRRIRWI
jgi:Xaa-Pro aminopeptidase